MDDLTQASLRGWESFYVIVGSSAGALTGLQFVVLTLITESGMMSGSGETLAAFGSPNVVHFCAALLVSAIMSVPWQALPPAGIAVALCGVWGFVYSGIVLQRARRQRDYKPELEDWIWHAALPIIAYGTLLVTGLLVSKYSSVSLNLIGAAALLLVFVGIHNAWDTVTYVTIQRARAQRRAAAKVAAPAPSEEGTQR
jgi:hypothetical protein